MAKVYVFRELQNIQLVRRIIYTVYNTSYILYTFWLCNVYLRFMAGGSDLLAKRSYFVSEQ